MYKITVNDMCFDVFLNFIFKMFELKVFSNLVFFLTSMKIFNYGKNLVIKTILRFTIFFLIITKNSSIFLFTEAFRYLVFT